MRLDDANVADEYGPDRFMPREVDGGERESGEVRDDQCELVLINGWACTFVDSCTCEGVGPDGHAAHRQGCGYEPFQRIDTRQHDAEVAASASRAALEWAAEEVRRKARFFEEQRQRGMCPGINSVVNHVTDLAAAIRGRADS